MNEHFSGVTSFDIFLLASPEVLLDPTQIEQTAAWESELESLDWVTKVRGVTSIYRAIDSAIWYRTESGLPPTFAAARASVDWARQMQESNVRSVINDTRNQIRVRVMVNATGFREVARLSESAERLARERLDPQITVEAGGSYWLIGRVIGDIVRSQTRGLGFCVASLFVIMMLGLRSLRVGLLAQLPNVLPAITMMGSVAWTQQFPVKRCRIQKVC